jgi:general secretion pathway protein E/type IV pilus assembly protein PilB
MAQTQLPSSAARRLVGQVLLAQGVVSEDQLRIALIEQARSYQLLGRLLVALGFISEAILRDALGESLGQRSVDLEQAFVDAGTLRLIPRDMAEQHRLLPLDYDADEKKLTVALADTTDIVALDRLRAALPPETKIESLLAGEAEIARSIDRHYGHELSIDGILQELETGVAERAGSANSYSQPVVRLVDALLTDAVKREASDIHFEPEAGFLRIRYRIDGTLRQIRALHKSYWSAMAVRLKVMSSMNIAETRAPQDGRVSLTISGRSVDFRVASQPTLHGENLVLRILDRHKGIVALADLGLAQPPLDPLMRMIARPEGILLVTGPTGSGKTTTLYSLLNHANSERVNIMTLEDPVEYPMAMIRQTSIADGAKLGFADGIRAMMRQDPDIILVGEIRDADTAAMAFRAAMTGHQVFSTLHSNSAIGAIPRLVDIGVRPDIMSGNIVGIVAQRLVRRLCPACREPYLPEGAERRLLGGGDAGGEAPVYRARGCPDCDYHGYRGRLAIMELLCCDDDIDDLIARGATARAIRQAAAARGFSTLAEEGLRRVLDGSTSLDEVARVVGLPQP